MFDFFSADVIYEVGWGSHPLQCLSFGGSDV